MRKCLPQTCQRMGSKSTGLPEKLPGVVWGIFKLENKIAHFFPPRSHRMTFHVSRMIFKFCNEIAEAKVRIHQFLREFALEGHWIGIWESCRMFLPISCEGAENIRLIQHQFQFLQQPLHRVVEKNCRRFKGGRYCIITLYKIHYENEPHSINYEYLYKLFLERTK